MKSTDQSYSLDLMNHLIEQNLSNLVEELTTSGSATLNERKIKQLKNICKQNDVNVEYCYRLLIAQINKEHSEIRYSTLQIIDQLFHRSHCFRTLLLDDFNNLIDKTLGLNVDTQLPPPIQTARLLKQLAATSIKNWHEKFHKTYKLLDIGYNYLKNCKYVNFDNVHEPIGITGEIRRERIQSNRLRLTQKLENATKELNETSIEIRSCIEQAENCLNLLVSKNDQFTTNIEQQSMVESDDDDDDDDDDFIEVPCKPKENDDRELLQLLGLSTAGKYSLSIDINERPKSAMFHIEMTDDNRILVENLHDLYKQLNDVYLNKIQTWMEIFIKVQETSNTQQIAAAMRKAIDMKNSVKFCLKMIDNYNLTPKRPAAQSKQVSPSIKPSASSPISESTSIPTLTDKEIRYFFHNDTECLKPNRKQFDIQNAFVRPPDNDDNMASNIDYSLVMRQSTFVSELPAVKWKCRVPLRNGKLCQRMDRYKCPFHGRIIARDELGQAADEEIRKLEEKNLSQQRSVPAWQDPEMLEDIRLATGIDLRANMKKKKKRKENGLTQLTIEENTVRKRLEKKLSNRASLKRIGAALDDAERRRNQEKFHHQFNYALNN